jgi:hypothetical protein
MIHRPMRNTNPDLRHQTQFPSIPIEAIEPELYRLLESEPFKPIQTYRQAPEKLCRERLTNVSAFWIAVFTATRRLCFEPLTQP